jgi:hypothetical protein
VANDDGGNDKRVDGSCVVFIAEAMGTSKHQAQPPTDHFEELLEQMCPNHAYSVMHNLKDRVTPQNFKFWNVTKIH